MSHERELRDEIASRVRQTLVMEVDTGMGGLEILTEVYKPEGVALIVADAVLAVPAIARALELWALYEEAPIHHPAPVDTQP